MVLFLSSAITTSVPLAAMGTFLYFQRQWGDTEASKSLGWLPLVSLIVFFVTYSGGMSNVPFIIIGEMFPSWSRPLLEAISSSFNLFCLFLTVYIFPDMLKGLGKELNQIVTRTQMKMLLNNCIWSNIYEHSEIITFNDSSFHRLILGSDSRNTQALIGFKICGWTSWFSSRQMDSMFWFWKLESQHAGRSR